MVAVCVHFITIMTLLVLIFLSLVFLILPAGVNAEKHKVQVEVPSEITRDLTIFLRPVRQYLYQYQYQHAITSPALPRPGC